MPLFIDIHHNLPAGAGPEQLAAAHQADIDIQARYGVDYRTYWLDAAAGTAVCLVEAPDAQAAAAVHRSSHGLVADEIYEVTQG